MQEKDGKTGGMVRAQSSLELLSETASLKNVLDSSSSSTEQAAVAGKEESERASSTTNSILLLAEKPVAAELAESANIASASFAEQQISPIVPARVTPADGTCFLDSKTRCSVLSLPEMMAGGPGFGAPLEQKRSSFLPAAFEGSTSCTDLENSPSYTPGLFLSYSNLSSTAGTSTATGSKAPGPSAVSSSTSADMRDGDHGAFLGQSFSSGNGSTASSSSFMPSTLNQHPTAPAPANMQAAFCPPRTTPTQLLQGVQRVSSVQLSEQESSGGVGPEGSTQHQLATAEDTVARDNFFLRQQLAAKDSTIEALQQQVAKLQKEVGQLRQLPTGKISQIPIEEMLSLMREYGSEVSETAMPPRKSYVQQASVVRQFRRWNPNFLQFFEFRDGSWHPKLGKAGELQRRQQARRLAAANRKKQQAEKDANGKQENIHQASL